MKQLVRSSALASRDALCAQMKHQKSQAICKQLEALLDASFLQFPLESQLTVAVYAAMPSEVDLTSFVRHAYMRGVRVVFPCMNRTEERAGRMVMRAVSKIDFERGDVPFVCSPIEAFEPDEALLAGFPIVKPFDIDMAVVPLVAYDNQNRRLGYGGGNYDGFLSRLRPQAMVVGAAFTEQRVDEVPCEAHDLPLPHIVTA